LNGSSWKKSLISCFVGNVDQPAKPVRLAIELFILQHMDGISDENVV
jgi:IS5 family transposase